MVSDRIWLGHLSQENRLKIHSALSPLGLTIREVPCPATAVSLTPEGALGILIIEADFSREQTTDTGLPTLWVLSSADQVPAFDGCLVAEFIRMPAASEEIVYRYRDLAATARREQALRRLEQNAADRSKQRRGLISAIAHDLSNPLAAVIEFLELLTDGTVGTPTSQQATLLHEARSAACGLHERIAEITDACRAEAGLSLYVHIEETDLKQVLADIEEWITPRLEEKDQLLKLNLEPSLPAVCGDPDRLRQVMRRLAENAHRFAPSGSTIQIDAARDREIGGYVLLTVSETESGAAVDEFRGCLEPFSSAVDGNPVRFRLGVGLTLVRAVAQALGGEMILSLRADRGSTIGIRIPIWNSRAARVCEAQALLTAHGELPASAWVCRACGPNEIAAAGEMSAWQTISPGEILAISENPPDGATRLGRVRDFRQAGSLESALQPLLQWQKIRAG